MPKKRILPRSPSEDTQGDRIVRAIRAHGLSHTFVAKMWGIQLDKLSKIIAGERKVSVHNLQLLADHLKIPLDSLIVVDLKKPEITVSTIISSDRMIERFFQCPMDRRLRQWIRSNLKMMRDVIEQDRPRLIRKRRMHLIRKKSVEERTEAERRLLQAEEEREQRLLEQYYSDLGTLDSTEDKEYGEDL